ncbi:oligopeptide/dipeptide ABC transporter ATP-binding protein [Desertimonas flava]|uniref:oligopeptide/dipeptide ABC transporter ATP-binding protein n=1 Tax=Desertimonas flava TaxID=2064846 RepID=UPI0013C49E67|nr:oligopeptide/dipeptide ABC transporter ATP-binding protein [Desertimonas flava]
MSFDVLKGETLGIVGESGCGKTTLGRCLTALMSPSEGGVYFALRPQEKDTLTTLHGRSAGQLSAEERAELTALDRAHRVDLLSNAAQREFRKNCQIVFQDAFASLNPRHRVIDIVGRPLQIHGTVSGKGRTKRVMELLDAVGLGPQHLNRYPHEFSGGQQQRISIARALALDPQVIVLDEPTSALDVSVQAQILNLLHELQEAFKLTYVFVSHDLGVIQHVSDRIVVMYLGEIVELGSTAEVFESPQHPYTRALIEANPALVDQHTRALRSLVGTIPDPARPPQGCRFHSRCPVATSRCGWALQDAAEWLSRHPAVGSGVKGVKAKTAFEGDILLAGEELASQSEQLLQENAPAALREALELASVDGAHLKVRFRGRDRVHLVEIKPAHSTSCLLAAEQPPSTSLSRQDLH